MNIVIPMAGVGKRFREKGFNQPKMLINVLSRPMLYWALQGLTPFFNKNTHIYFICLSETVKEYNLKDIIDDVCPIKYTILELNSSTKGQAETVLKASHYLDNHQSLLIYNCDTYVDLGVHKVNKKKLLNYDGVIWSFHSDQKHYSYIEADQDGIVRKVAEKEKISNKATTGLYFFKHGSLFIKAARNAIKNNELVNGEYYVGPLYNNLIKNNLLIKTFFVNNCLPLGTPEELNRNVNLLKRMESNEH